MTNICLVANDQLLAVASQPTIAAGDVNSVKLHVDFSEEWNSYAKSAVFFTSKDETPYEKILTNGECVIPAEVLAEAGILYIGIRGVNSNTAEVKTSTLVKYKIKEGAPEGTGTTVEPTASVYQQLLTAYGKTDAALAVERSRIDSMIAGDSMTNTTYELWINDNYGLTSGSMRIETNGSDAIIIIEQFTITDPGKLELCSFPEELTPLGELRVTTAEDILFWYENGSLWASTTNLSPNPVDVEEIHYSLKQAFTPSELSDIRIGADGTVYGSAGEAVRSQVSDVANKMSNFSTILQFGNINNTGIELGGIASSNEIVSTTITRCDDYISVIGGNTIYAILENTTIKYISILMYDKDKTYISGPSNLYGRNMTSAATLTREIALPENCAYIRFYMGSSGAVDYKVGLYYSYYNATTVEEYVEPTVYVNADQIIKDGDFIDWSDSKLINRLSADKEAMVENYIVPEYEYNVHMVDALRKRISYLQDYIATIHAPTILDSGNCGANLTWTLYSDGLLKISGTGRAYDYCKGILIGKTREEIETYCETSGHTEYGFQEGKTYDDVNGQYVSPWYKYRDEVDFVSYCNKDEYDTHNPNGWKYNRIEIDEGITYLGDWMFYRVSGATELIVPNTVTELGDWAIRYSPTLKCIHLPDSITIVGYRGCSRNEVATAIRLGSGMTTLGDYAFAQNAMVKYMCLQGNSETKGSRIFDACSNVEYISFNGIAELGSYACSQCYSLVKVDLPDTLTAIHNHAFVNISTLKSIKIPSSVETIGDGAFVGCTALKTVYIDSPTIAATPVYVSGCGSLLANAKYVYVKDDITEICPYITNYFTKTSELEGYMLYIRNE